MSKRGSFPIALGLGLSLLGMSCSEHVEVGRDLALSGGAAGAAISIAGLGGNGGLDLNTGGTTDASSGGSDGGVAHACSVTPCQGQVYQCGDCIDNDGDGLIDSDDPDCWGPCDNTENSYYGGIVNQNNAPCRQGCYFHGETGSASDRCYWDHECDPLSVAPGYPPSGDSRCSYDPSATIPGSGSTCAELSVTQAPECLSYCLPITPNGCDCFGCCELPADSGQFVWIGSNTKNVGTCDAAHVGDPSACEPCTPVASCFKACDPCEVCVGRAAPAASCATLGSGRCAAGVAECGQPGEADCPADNYCITGCCQEAPR